jgi:ankyrin repeat protein
MTSRRITPQTTLDNLKKEAKRFLKLLLANDAEAREQFTKVYPKAPGKPGLRDVQHAMALRYGFQNWKALKDAVENQPKVPAQLHDRDAHWMTRFFEFACPDHHVRGRPAHRIAEHAAMRILQQHPEISRDNFYTAIVCGEIDIVQRVLREHPEAARMKSGSSTPDRTGVGGSDDIFRDIGPKGWEPLSYLCFTRLDLPNANENAVAIAGLLLDHGADPNAYFMAGDSHYTPLTGVIGEGEEDRPPHPRRDELVRLLLERGAEPYDSQVIYNIHFHGEVLWYLKLMHEFSVKAGRKADWDDPEWHMLDQGGYGTGARWHLRTAIEHNDLELAEWCLQHGANPNTAPERDQRFPQKSLYEFAVLLGHLDMAELLVRYGAVRDTPTLEGEDSFVAACFRLDREAAKTQAAQHPEYLTSHKAMHAAAKHDRADVIGVLVDLGVSAEVANPRGGDRPLHVAAYAGAENAVDTLIRAGAKIDPVDSVHDATPLWFAMWAQRTRVITLLSRYSRDVWALSFTGNVERVREVLLAEPRLATMSGESTPLFWLPEEEDRAVDLVTLFLELGADASFRRKEDGLTAADVARRRGLNRAADLLAAAAAEKPKTASPASPEVASYERLARDMVSAYATGDEEAIQRINQHYNRNTSAEDLRAMVWRLTYKVRQASGSAEAFQLPEAQEMIARTSGFPNWAALAEAVAKGEPALGPVYAINAEGTTIEPRRIPTKREWDTIIGVMKERRIPRVNCPMMTDEALKQISELDFVIGLNMGGSRELSDDGMQYLARMPQLEHLDLSEYPGGKLTDRGLEVLRHLPNLRTFQMTWQKGISDVGAANLRFCDKLEVVNLMGSPTGDGAVAALRGKPKLRRFDTGRLVTDAGLPLLHEFPMFKTWRADQHPDSAGDPDFEPTHLLIDGPFTNEGFATLEGLDGVYALDLFWHVTAITSDAFAHLLHLRNLGSLGCDGQLSDNIAMGFIGRLPRLRKLRAQGSAATDDGFIALSRSQTLERFWGREAPHLTGRGFAAFHKMPALQALGVSCRNVDDSALSTLPQFPSLRQLTPIDVPDEGFRHIGRCARLEDLSCMYCRDTTDVSTEHIAGLRLKKYYAGLTQITDRSLEVLGRMDSLEVVELFETKKVSDAGLAHLVKLPRLKRVELSGLPNVTLAGTKVFPARVEVKYDV